VNGPDRWIVLEEEIWAYLRTDGKLTQVMAGEKDIAWLIGEVLKLTALAQAATHRTDVLLPVRPRSAVAGTDRQRAVSIILANEVSKDPAVADFRARVLKGQLLGSRRAAADWIFEQVALEAPSTAWLTDIPVPEGYELRRDPETGYVVTDPVLKIAGAAGARGIRYRVLSDDLSSGKGVYTAAGGTVEQLRQLSEDLAARFRWQMDHATVFVLTGQIPDVVPIKIRAEVSKTFPVCSRVILEVDPTLTPKDVARAYFKVRRSFWPRRIRTVGQKHASLAAFIEERSSGQTWRQRFSEWNRTTQSDWKYRSESNFRRDAVVARRRLLTPSTWADNVDVTGEPPIAELEKSDATWLPVAMSLKQAPSKPTSRRRKKRR
jgi:hypothetical protein